VNQAIRSVYGVALAMVTQNWELSSRSHTYSAIGNMKLTTPLNGGELFPVSSDPDGLQGLDPSLAICDEIGFMPVQSWDSLLLASGKRPRSLVVGIGTPGFDKSNALWHLRQRTLEGHDIPGFVFTEYAADDGCDIGDHAQWRKANPALDEGYMNEAALETAVALSPESHFRIFRLGQWHDGAECWLGDDGRKVWDACIDEFDHIDGAPTWLGVDVGLKRDSTAVVRCQRRADGRLHVAAKIWTPTPDGKLDVADIMGHLRSEADRFDVREIAFDPRLFELPAQMLADEGYPMVEFPQSVERMTPAVGLAFESIKRGEVAHDGDPLFTQHVLNAIARMNERGFTLAKGKSRGHIDAAVAMCIAIARASAVEVKTPTTGLFLGVT
jgi:phage terminase large subunit-like protein